MSEPTEPNFEQRITALEAQIRDGLYNLDCLVGGSFGGEAPTSMVRSMERLWENLEAVCAIARDYYRRPEVEG